MENKNPVEKKTFPIEYLIFGFMAIYLLIFFSIDLYSIFNPTYAMAPLGRVFILVFACFMGYLAGILRVYRTHNPTVFKYLMILFFALYLNLLLDFTLLDSAFGRGIHSFYQGDREKYLKYFTNFVPFKSIYSVYIKGFSMGKINFSYLILNLLGNLCAMMPFAFFLPAIWKAQKKWYIFFPTVLLCAVALEGVQFAFMLGSCDVDDLILNAGGAFLLYPILKIPRVSRFLEKFQHGFIKNTIQ